MHTFPSRQSALCISQHHLGWCCYEASDATAPVHMPRMRLATTTATPGPISSHKPTTRCTCPAKQVQKYRETGHNRVGTHHHASLASVSALNAQNLVSDALPLVAISSSADCSEHHHRRLPRPGATQSHPQSSLSCTVEVLLSVKSKAQYAHNMHLASCHNSCVKVEERSEPGFPDVCHSTGDVLLRCADLSRLHVVVVVPHKQSCSG